MQNEQGQNQTVLNGGVEYVDYKPYIKNFNENLKKTLINTSPLGLNPASRAYAYNLAGVSEMTNKDFTPLEIKQLKDALNNAKVIKTDKPIAVHPIHYNGDVAETTGWINPVKNAIINPMRMVMGTMLVSPEGKVLHQKDGELYYGEPYDFSPEVQGNKNFNPVYQFLQNLGTRARGENPMMMNIDLGQ